MTITERDLDLYAARVRPYFEPPLRDTAEALALEIAQLVGALARNLRPETRFTEIREWIRRAAPDSLGEVERMMSLAKATGFEAPSALAGRLTMTFRDWVEAAAKQRH